MPRFVKQRDHYACGPVAIANAIKALGGKINYSKTRKVLCTACRCSPKTGGTDSFQLMRSLKKFLPIYLSGDITISWRNYPPVSQIRKHVELKGVVVLTCFRKGDDEGHFYTIVSSKKNLFTTANDLGKTIVVCRHSALRKKSERHEGWFIRKKDG